MRVSLAATVVAGLVVFASAPPALAADVAIDGTRALPDRDTRTGQIRPAAAQRADARALGARVNWNRFGTPSSLVDPGGALATGVRGATPAAAARAWLDANAALFRLDSADGLELQSDNALAGGAGHAVTFRQVVGGLDASGGGLVTIGLRRDGDWRVISAAGSLHGGTSLAGKPQLAPEQAVQKAAANAGEERSLAQIVPVDKPAAEGFDGFKLAGVPDVQSARAVAFPTVGDGWVPAYETIVLDSSGAEPEGYQTYVDARSGAILARESVVDHAAEAALAPVTFSGELPAQDGGCDVLKGPYAVADGAGVRAIDVLADASTPAQDIVLKLFRGTTLVAQADTVRTPERIRYAPATGVPPGDYFVQVCEFGDGAPPAEPRDVLRHDHARHEHAARGRTPRAGTRSAAPRRTTPSTPTRGTTRAPTRARSGAGRRAAPRATATTWSATWRRARRGTSTRSSTRRPTRRSATTRGRPSRGPTAASRAPPSSSPPARSGTTASRGRTPGARPTATRARRTARPSCPARASTSRRPRRTCSSSTTGCTTGRTCSASPRTTGTRRPRTSG